MGWLDWFHCASGQQRLRTLRRAALKAAFAVATSEDVCSGIDARSAPAVEWIAPCFGVLQEWQTRTFRQELSFFGISKVGADSQPPTTINALAQDESLMALFPRQVRTQDTILEAQARLDQQNADIVAASIADQ